MDTITHGLLGLNIANLGFRKRLGAKTSYLTALVAANAPDADIVLALRDRATYTYWHRGVTHSLLGLILFPPLLAYVVHKITKASFRDLYLLCAIAQGTHLFLDVFNFWGTMLGSPFDQERYAVPWMFTFDIFMLLILGIPLLLQRFAKMDGEAVSAPAIGILGVYYGLCGVGHSHAVEATRQAAAIAGIAPETIEAYPRPFLPTLWNGVASTGYRVVQVDVNVVSKKPVKTIRVFDRKLDNPLVRLALAGDVGRPYTWFAPQAIGAPLDASQGNETRVALYDMRFYPPPSLRLKDARNSVAFPVRADGGLGAPTWGAPWPEPLRTLDGSEIHFGAGATASASQ